MSGEQARFVPGAVYRKPRQDGGWSYGVLFAATEEVSGRQHGRITEGDKVPEPISAADMKNWELVSEHATSHVRVGPRFVTEEDLAKAVTQAVAAEVSAMRDRLTEIEADLVRMRAKVAHLTGSTSSRAKVA